jgi:hypothetical protein
MRGEPAVAERASRRLTGRWKVGRKLRPKAIACGGPGGDAGGFRIVLAVPVEA